MVTTLQGVFGGLLKALNDFPVSTFIRESVWIYPIDQVIHLLFLTVLGNTRERIRNSYYKVIGIQFGACFSKVSSGCFDGGLATGGK
mgnify:CR=1 FL=1